MYRLKLRHYTLPQSKIITLKKGLTKKTTYVYISNCGTIRKSTDRKYDATIFNKKKLLIHDLKNHETVKRSFNLNSPFFKQSLFNPKLKFLLFEKLLQSKSKHLTK